MQLSYCKTFLTLKSLAHDLLSHRIKNVEIEKENEFERSDGQES